MSWQEAIGGLMILLGTGGALIVLAELLCGMIDIPRRKPESEEFEEDEADSEYMQNRERQLRAMAKHRAAATDPLADADADALVAQISREIEAEAAAAVKRCGVR